MVGRDDNEVLNLYRGECKFAALHMSAFGTKRTYRDDLLIVRFWRTADMRSRPALIASDANDPDRTQTGLAGCDRKQPARERPKLQPLLPKHPLDRVGEAALAGDAVAEFGHARGRIAALAGAVALSLAPEIGGSARAQTGDDTAGGSINIGARAGLAGDAPVRTAPRQDGAAGPFELSARAGFASDYIYRGVTLSDRKPAVGAGLEAALGLLYAGATVTSVRLPTQPAAEITMNAGVRPSLGNIDFDFGWTYFLYPGETVPPGVLAGIEYWRQARAPTPGSARRCPSPAVSPTRRTSRIQARGASTRRSAWASTCRAPRCRRTSLLR